MFDCKEVSRFIGDELVQVYQAVKEDTYLLIVLLQLLEWEVTLLLRFDHIIHLAQQVHEKDRFMV